MFNLMKSKYATFFSSKVMKIELSTFGGTPGILVSVCMIVVNSYTPFKPTSPGNFPGESLHILRAGRPGKVLEHLSDRPQFPRGSCHGYESPESLVRCTGSNRAASERGFRLRHAQLRNFGVKQ